MKGGGRGYIIYIRARNMCAQTEAGKRENRDSGYEEKKKQGKRGLTGKKRKMSSPTTSPLRGTPPPGRRRNE